MSKLVLELQVRPESNGILIRVKSRLHSESLENEIRL